MRRVYTAALATLALLGAVEAQANYTKTKYPIVLVHGVTGFNTIGGLVNYFLPFPGTSSAMAPGCTSPVSLPSMTPCSACSMSSVASATGSSITRPIAMSWPACKVRG